MDWVKASWCEAGNCVEVSHKRSMTYVRSSDGRDVAVAFTPDEWSTFLAAVRAGEFDRPATS